MKWIIENKEYIIIGIIVFVVGYLILTADTRTPNDWFFKPLKDFTAEDVLIIAVIHAYLSKD